MNKYLAADFRTTFGNVSPPPELKGLQGASGINTLLGNVVSLVFIIAAVAFTLIFLYSALQMILSGGNKESVAAARARITWAIIGLVVLSLAFVIFRVIQHVTGVNLILNP